MVVGPREDYPKRDSLAIDDEVAFCAELTTIGRVFARFIPPFTGAETVTLSSDCHFQSMPLQAVIFQQTEPPEFGEDPGSGPFLEMLMGRGTGAILAW